MAKILFDAKYRPQIESGEYKVETRDGRSARIICWNAEGSGGELIVLIKQGNNEVTCRYYRNGSYLSNAEHSLDLFIITPDITESEDERIRKDIRLVIESAATRYFKETGKMPEYYDRIVAYLEKQKEQKPADNVLKEEYVKRFKVLCDAYEIKLPNREYDIYYLCNDLFKLFTDSDEQKSTECSEEDEIKGNKGT